MKRALLFSLIVLVSIAPALILADPPKVHDPKKCAAETERLETLVRKLRRDKSRLEKENEKLLDTVGKLRDQNKEIRQQLETAQSRDSKENGAIQAAIQSGLLSDGMTFDEAKLALKNWGEPRLVDRSSNGDVYRWIKHDAIPFSSSPNWIPGSTSNYAEATFENNKIASWRIWKESREGKYVGPTRLGQP